MAGYIPPSKRAECSGCGTVRWRSSSSASVIICLPCRRKPDHQLRMREAANEKLRAQRAEGRTPSTWTPCVDCGKRSRGERCDPCFRKATSRGGTKNTRRLLLERSAAGPWTEWRRNHALLPEWRAAGSLCSYCGIAAVEEVDHIVPLARGGTNEIDNLAPACHSCNSIKSDRLLSELGWEVLGDTEAVAPQGRYRGRRGAEA